MKIEVNVVINDSPNERLTLDLPEDMITIHAIEQMVSDFISDRLIKFDYPKRRIE